MPANDIYAKIQDTRVVLVDILSSVNRQVDWFAARDGDDRFSTVTGNRLNTKPFIIGFLPPDVNINFVPIQEVGARLRENTGLVQEGTKTGLRKVNLGAAELVQKQQTHCENSELREALFQAHVNAMGQRPNEDFLCMAYAQVNVIEAPNCSSFNYNLGGNHASHGGLSATGKLPDPCDRSSADDVYAASHGGAQLSSPAALAGVPASGKYVSSTDTYDTPKLCDSISGKKFDCRCKNGIPGCSGADAITVGGNGSVASGTILRPGDIKSGKNRCAMIVNFRAFDSLQAGADYYMTNLLGNCPDIRGASTFESYTAGLTNCNGNGTTYYSSGVKTEYEEGIRKGCEQYRRQFGDKPLGDVIPKFDKEVVLRDVVMKSSAATIPDEEIGDKMFDYGRNIRIDQERLHQVNEQTLALKRQAQIFELTPPLAMLVNPSDFTRSYEQSVDDGVKGRQKNIPHLWLEKPISISCRGVTAAQYVISEDGTGGLTHQRRIHSLSYLNLMSLVEIYKNNGMIYTGPNVGYSPGNIGIAQLPMSVFIYYDNHLYIGSFDDFEITDTGDKPYNMSYSFKFTVRYDEFANLGSGRAPSAPSSIAAENNLVASTEGKTQEQINQELFGGEVPPNNTEEEQNQTIFISRSIEDQSIQTSIDQNLGTKVDDPSDYQLSLIKQQEAILRGENPPFSPQEAENLQRLSEGKAPDVRDVL